MPIEFRCVNCRKLLRVADSDAGRRAQCPECGAVLTVPSATANPDFVAVAAVDDRAGPPPAAQYDSSKRLAAGLCGVLLGGLGVHKFILGLNGPGTIMLLVTLAPIGITFATCGFGVPLMLGTGAMHVIGLVEGIIYLTKSDAEFHQLYIVEKKGWF
jgi:TM2 domain-containing membrane protein YozV